MAGFWQWGTLCFGQPNCTIPSAANISAWKGGSGAPSPLASLFLPDPCPGTSGRFLAVHAMCFG